MRLGNVPLEHDWFSIIVISAHDNEEIVKPIEFFPSQTLQIVDISPFLHSRKAYTVAVDALMAVSFDEVLRTNGLESQSIVVIS